MIFLPFSLFSLPRLLLLLIAAAAFFVTLLLLLLLLLLLFPFVFVGFSFLFVPRTLRQPLGQQPAQQRRGEPSRAATNPNGAHKGRAEEERSSMTMASNSCRTSGREGAGGVAMEEGTRRCRCWRCSLTLHSPSAFALSSLCSSSNRHSPTVVHDRALIPARASPLTATASHGFRHGTRGWRADGAAAADRIRDAAATRSACRRL